jgi:hypothetical protein
VGHRVISQATMDKYYFDWARVYVVPLALLQPIPFGPSIS